MNLQCWKCGKPLQKIILPFSRREECGACHADQHVCRLCIEYDPTISDACREDRADFVLDKEKANFCDYFKPKPDAFQAADDSAAKAARAQLAELFGEPLDADSEVSEAEAKLSESERAMQELKRLFDD